MFSRQQKSSMRSGIPTHDAFVQSLLISRREATEYMTSATVGGKRGEARQWAKGIRKIDAMLARFGVVAGAQES
jgi:hypothetical protein